MTQPLQGGRWLRDPETGAMARDENTEALEADAKPPSAEGEAPGTLSTDTSADTNTPAKAKATKAKGR
ncbi:hypothetical protein C8J27_11071 [Rhodobacter aestuarii]|uniref:Uncharacterized protein n=1 Tax=Rhodobacter aestuarii TaxID=453582 RepID=A0A1N7Q1F0_9RHOB|nr:hypothetical protein [Rhodobacter aestuarii]PTV94020.1 hypothetical protein C8J27_11071 [Rhodobacter aestuarii]SIT16641.1 hypothetical protein SAMN05421580_11271 [Rhodobacter aestuarii]